MISCVSNLSLYYRKAVFLFMEKRLTEGSPMRLIIGFGVPMLFGMLFQQLYNLVDTMIVGKLLGADALAAVGSTGAVNFLIIGFCIGLTSGFAIPVAQQFGAGHEREMKKYVSNSVWLSAVLSIILTVLTVIFCRQILVAMQTPEDIIDGAYSYIVVIFAGIPAIVLYNLLSGIVRSLGDSKTPVVFLAISSVINIVLDYVFIKYFNMGVAGAAYATVISQGVSGLACLFFMLRRFTVFQMPAEDWKPGEKQMKLLLAMGVPMGLQYSVTAIGSVVLQVAVNSLGTQTVAAVTAASRVTMLLYCPFDAMGSTMATYGGQNVGAGRLERLHQGMRSCILLGLIYSVLAVGIIFLFGRYTLLLFLDPGETLILSYAVQFLHINVLFAFPLALVNIIRFMIQGMGFSTFAILSGIFEMIARSVTGFFFVKILGFMAVCFASPSAWILADAFLVPAYFYCYNKLNRRRTECREAYAGQRSV